MEVPNEDTYDYYLVLDFEATCNEGNWKNPEIIEFPTVILNAKTLQTEDEFHHYIKPTLNPVLTPFCIELTGIQQEWVDSGVILSEALDLFHNWLVENGLINTDGTMKKNWIFVTCGDWDLQKMLPSQMRREKLKDKRNEYFRRWVNIKKIFSNFYSRDTLTGMAGMLNALKMELVGRHHSGIDDCRNIARIVQRLLKEGAVVKQTSTLAPSKQELKDEAANASAKQLIESSPEEVLRLLEFTKSWITLDILRNVASEYMNKENVQAVPVKDHGRIFGLFTKRVLDELKNSSEAENLNKLNNPDKKKLTEAVSNAAQKFAKENVQVLTA